MVVDFRERRVREAPKWPLNRPLCTLVDEIIPIHPPIQVKIISEVLSRSCHFLATPSLESQASALGCVRDCVLKLATAGVEPGT